MPLIRAMGDVVSGGRLTTNGMPLSSGDNVDDALVEEVAAAEARPADGESSADENLFLLAACYLSEDGNWQEVSKDFDALARAARDLAFEINAIAGSAQPWPLSVELQRTFQGCLSRAQKRNHHVPASAGEENHKQARELLRRVCPPAFALSWGVPPQAVLENGALACRRIAAEADRLLKLSEQSRHGRSGRPGGRRPQAGLNAFLSFCYQWKVPLRQIVRVARPLMPKDQWPGLRKLLEDRIRALPAYKSDHGGRPGSQTSGQTAGTGKRPHKGEFPGLPGSAPLAQSRRQDEHKNTPPKTPGTRRPGNRRRRPD